MGKALDDIRGIEKNDNNFERPTNEEILKDLDESTSREETINNEILGTIFNDEQLPKITDLTKKSAVTFAQAEFIADYFDIPQLRLFANLTKEHLISNGRKGRTELITVAQSQMGMGDYGVDEEPSTLDKIFKPQ